MILGLELTDFWGTVNAFRDSARAHVALDRQARREADQHHRRRPVHRRRNYQDFQRYPEVDLAMAADAEATLPALIEAVQAADHRRSQARVRGARHEAGRRPARDALERARAEATYAWDASPISTARLSAELWAQIKNEDWSLVAESGNASGWPLRLWNFDKHYQCIGGVGRRRHRLRRAGRGRRGAREQEARPAVGHHPERRRLHVRARRAVDRRASPDSAAARDAQQPRVPPGGDARAAHGEPAQPRHRRARSIGTTLDDPNIDYAKIAQGMGVHAEGPITESRTISGPAIKRAIDVVKRGEPALVDVVTQPR